MAAVRNFWIEARIDGRSTPIAAGPAGKDGGFRMQIWVRRDGKVAAGIRITGEADADGTLWLRATPGDAVDVTDGDEAGFIARSQR